MPDTSPRSPRTKRGHHESSASIVDRRRARKGTNRDARTGTCRNGHPLAERRGVRALRHATATRPRVGRARSRRGARRRCATPLRSPGHDEKPITRLHGTQPRHLMRTLDTASTLESLPPLTRRCGRCRRDFPGDPLLGETAQKTWWLCPPCRHALLGDVLIGLPSPGRVWSAVPQRSRASTERESAGRSPRRSCSSRLSHKAAEIRSL